ncbi:hypothetical protein QYE76_021627 [Lolium multiflorum]|uniref:Uncharacterized protein n=1 Tax=Lolium multiflorum TaxID=4521 RepID=A0AAD8R746_LOLMU|nr:hypothetical protein QYE76_021627 [Lolium multiflorum]
MGSAPPHDALLPLDPETFAAESRPVVDFLSGYYRDVEKYPVRSAAEPCCIRTLLPDTPPEHGDPVDVILEDVRRHIVPELTHWQSPDFFAYFPMNASTAGFPLSLHPIVESPNLLALVVLSYMEQLLITKYKLKNNGPPVKVCLYMGQRCEWKVQFQWTGQRVGPTVRVEGAVPVDGFKVDVFRKETS